jgi:hypothetical protein
VVCSIPAASFSPPGFVACSVVFAQAEPRAVAAAHVPPARSVVAQVELSAAARADYSVAQQVAGSPAGWVEPQAYSE